MHVAQISIEGSHSVGFHRRRVSQIVKFNILNTLNVANIKIRYQI